MPSDIPNYIKQLTSRNYQAESFDLGDPKSYLLATTAEGSAVCLDVMAFWRIIDVELAARTAMEILVIEEDSGYQQQQ